MVERGPEKAGVGGSIPSLATIKLTQVVKSNIRDLSSPKQILGKLLESAGGDLSCSR